MSENDPASPVIPPPAEAAAFPRLISISPSLIPSTPLSGAEVSETKTWGPVPISIRPISNPGRNSTSTPDMGRVVNTKPEKLDLSTFALGYVKEQVEDEEELLLLLRAIERDVLDLFSDSYCNKHLVYSIVEVVLVKLVPELMEHGVGELMAERGL
ncbi:hypothetical protein CISG_01971 [Coccidioides immitis RMSCC 3703]|uniref:PXA domain-containing protein n=1 Tax=Coccidioides immitis RMSCC 3703 TaxID=454286 RepID=A0A0J8R739_COCIT|nr:hypothetical protein CISG_01971 [Coccidioides immitis RMSCC 3703]